MAGRGRGRGGNSGLSFTHEQLHALGVARGENPAPLSIPPPLFPKLERRPLPLNCDAATDYMLIVKDQFIEYLHDSPAYVKAKVISDGVERYSDRYKILALESKQGKILDCVWANMPMELRPQAKRLQRVSRKRKLDDVKDIEKRLETLEKMESLNTEDNMVTNEGQDIVKTEEGNDDEEEIEDEQEQEDEIDDGTDYANNYFDNGEDYEDEDDNLDDGPVY